LLFLSFLCYDFVLFLFFICARCFRCLWIGHSEVPFGFLKRL
jgi:hypothetical protein